MSAKVCKFGGSSLADADQLRKVKAIVDADPRRRYIVPSAPGRRTPDDQKITDLLYLCHASAEQRIGIDETFNRIADRYTRLAKDLGLALDLTDELEGIRRRIEAGATADYTASRGEYLNARIIAEMLGCEMVDAAQIIHFKPNGRFDADQTHDAVSQRLRKLDRAVVPGFYGSLPDGAVKTFSRGGSDITGAIVAHAVNAEVYENWTDVSGLLQADPRIIQSPLPIATVTYAELRELAYMGATVLHDEAIFPVRQAGIPVNIRNTNAPDDPGTMIVKDAAPIAEHGRITGIAGRKDFTIIHVEKSLMNAEVGFGHRLLGVLERHSVNFEHLPSGIDTMSLVVADSELQGKLDEVLAGIRADCKPDGLDVQENMALVATVGRGMASTPGMAARLFTALADARVNIRMIDQGSSELNIIVGIAADDFETAMRAIYAAFVKP